MTSTPEFLVEVYQNQYLPMGAREVSAVVSVTATDIAATVHEPAPSAPRSLLPGGAWTSITIIATGG